MRRERGRKGEEENKEEEGRVERKGRKKAFKKYLKQILENLKGENIDVILHCQSDMQTAMDIF